MPGWIKVALWIAGIWVACYAFGTSPAAVVGDIFHALSVMHQTSSSR